MAPRAATARDDHGARGAGLLGGYANVPASMRPLVEVLLILEDAHPGKLAASWIRKKIRDQAVATLRTKLRREATEYAKDRLARHARRLNRAMRKLSPEEKLRISRRLQWDIERRYFANIEQGAVRHMRSLRARLDGTMTRTTRKQAQSELAKAEKLREAARVKPVAGRLPVNHRYAGKWLPASKLPKKYRKKGLRFTKDGYPDFGPYAVKLPNGKRSVRIKYTGRRGPDTRMANKAAGIDSTQPPKGYTWHHYQDGETMQLVPADLHSTLRHTGGTAHYKHVTGDTTVYPD